MNVRTNAQSTSDDASAKTWLEDLQQLEESAVDLQRKLKEVLQKRGRIEATVL